ncbi:hypothetical protein JZO82_00405 [Vagococcus fluvialis]|uniref:hypothetical protein n=1 Tax=Vagococcus fluvialis TaxID=2738 RepID=UPI001A8DFB12|nr:hypothetical protein [Vagococcus fluvialis]MBO0427612.1 hypothetical protein [Vagococcus fluvialis]
MYLILIGFILVYLILRLLAVGYHAKSMDAKPDDASDEKARTESWEYFNKYDLFNTLATISVLLLSLVGFFIELSVEKSGLNIALIIVYTLILVSTVSSLFDAMEYRIERARELNIPRGEKDKIMKWIVKKIK